MNLARLLAAVTLCTGLAGCDSAADIDNVGEKGCTPLDYNNGVLYFPCIVEEFGNGLSQYVDEHPDLRVISVAPNDTGLYGYTAGYFVVVTPK